MRAILVCGLIAAALICARRSEANATRVLLRHLIEPDCAHESSQAERDACHSMLEETNTRLSAELQSAGYEVLTVAAVGAPEPLLAELLVRLIDRRPAVDVILPNRSDEPALMLTVRVLEGSQARAPALLAVRALEVLRASTAQLELKEAVPPEPAPAEVSTAPLSAEPPSLPRSQPSTQRTYAFAAALHGVLLRGFPGLGTQLAPALSLTVSGERGLQGRLFAVGPSFGKRIRGEAGSARIHELMFPLLLGYGWAWDEKLSVAVELGVGPHLLVVRGTARAPYAGQKQNVLALAYASGVQARITLPHRLALLVGAHGYLTQPSLRLRIAQERVITVGGPALLASFGLEFGR